MAIALNVSRMQCAHFLCALSVSAVDSKACVGVCVCTNTCVLTTELAKHVFLCEPLKANLVWINVHVFTSVHQCVHFYQCACYYCSGTLNFEMLEIVIRNRDPKICSTLITACNHASQTTQLCGLANHIVRHVMGFNITGKNIKNVTRCRDSRSAKSIETR